MEDTRSFQEKSFQNNLDNFLKKLTDLEFYQLVNFFNSTFMNEEANELQTEFIDEFFGLDEWKVYVETCRASSTTFYHNYYMHVGETMKKVKEYLLFRMSHRFLDLLSDKANAKLEVAKLEVKNLNNKETIELTKLNVLKLRLDLLKAFDKSHVDGVFWKDEGWCNISDVLIKYNLLKIENNDSD